MGWGTTACVLSAFLYLRVYFLPAQRDEGSTAICFRFLQGLFKQNRSSVCTHCWVGLRNIQPFTVCEKMRGIAEEPSSLWRVKQTVQKYYILQSFEPFPDATQGFGHYRELFTPLGVIYPPIDVNAQPETVLPHWGVCVLF